MAPEPNAQDSEKRKMSGTTRNVLIGVGVALAILVLIAVPLALMSQPSFLARYPGFSDNYKTLQASAHKDIACGQCHRKGVVAYDAQLTLGFYRGLLMRNNEIPVTAMQNPANEACLSCHAQDWSFRAARTSRIPHPAHLRVIDEQRPCVKCHKWTAHQENNLEKHKKMPFSGVCVAYGCHVGWKTKDQCSTCHHVLYKGAQEWKVAHPKFVQASGDLACLEKCHSIDQCRLCHTTGKTPVFKGLAVETGLKAIEIQHEKKDWINKHGTFGLQDQSKCLQCHVSVGECQSCHSKRPAFHGSVTTWIGTHKTVAKKVDDPRCLTCHKKAWCDDCHAKFKEMR